MRCWGGMSTSQGKGLQAGAGGCPFLDKTVFQMVSQAASERKVQGSCGVYSTWGQERVVLWVGVGGIVMGHLPPGLAMFPSLMVAFPGGIPILNLIPVLIIFILILNPIPIFVPILILTPTPIPIPVQVTHDFLPHRQAPAAKAAHTNPPWLCLRGARLLAAPGPRRQRGTAREPSHLPAGMQGDSSAGGSGQGALPSWVPAAFSSAVSSLFQLCFLCRVLRRDQQGRRSSPSCPSPVQG